MRVLVVIVVSLLVAGCVPDLDRDQSRLCRMTLPAVVGGDAAIEVIRQTKTAGGGIRVEYRKHGRAGFVECAFGTGLDRLRLEALRTPNSRLSVPRIVMMQRFWLSTPEALAADPEPVPGMASALPLPEGSGYAVQQFVKAIPGASI